MKVRSKKVLSAAVVSAILAAQTLMLYLLMSSKKEIQVPKSLRMHSQCRIRVRYLLMLR